MPFVDYPRGQPQVPVETVSTEQALAAMRTWQFGTRAVYAEAVGAGMTIFAILFIPYAHIMMVLPLLLPWIIGHAACMGDTYRAWLAAAQGSRNASRWAAAGAFTALILPVVGLLVADVLRTGARRRLLRSGIRVHSFRHIAAQISSLEQELMKRVNQNLADPSVADGQPVN